MVIQKKRRLFNKNGLPFYSFILSRIMYKLLLLTASLLLFAFCSFSQQGVKSLSAKNNYHIESSDSKDDILLKAIHVVPTENQYRALQDEFIAFIHFGPNTFTQKEWGNGMEDPAIFDLKDLDTDQWCEAMKAAGMKMVILTVKHHDGFVLWQSRYTEHGIMSTGFQDGKGDILKELTASCEKYGLKLGIYLSPADLFQIESPSGLYGNLSKYTERTIPRPIEGRPFKDQRNFKFKLDDYNEYFLNQLFELLTEYGPIHEVWFDGAHPKTKGGQAYNYQAWKELITELAPKAVIFGKEDIRWGGNESGATRETEWNVIPYKENPDTLISFPDLTAQDIGSRAKLWDANYLHYQQAEINTSIREGWFYRDDTYQKVRSADDVFDIYERSVGGNATFLLNIPPNREGKLSPEDVGVLNEVGKRIDETYQKNLLNGAKGQKNSLDGKENTYALLNNNTLEISLPKEVKVNRFVIQEAIRTHGERIESLVLDSWINGQWIEIANATNVGYKRILRFPDVITNRFRLRVLESRATPVISNISAHYSPARPPSLAFDRNIEGIVSVEPVKSEFGWKPHGEDISKNLNMDFRIHYTLDGAAPTAKSPVYTEPIYIQSKTLKAVAISEGVNGSEKSQDFGFVKKAWKILNASSAINEAKKTIDGDSKSFWQSEETGPEQFVSIDLGKEKQLASFSYTPQTKNNKGMMERGVVKISNDGKHWKEVQSFEFGNLINDPSTRTHRLKEKVHARYIRIESKGIAGGGSSVAIAELEFFE